jgi:predicted adenine nucleotide alpha hydrolase (AANH) superfamily ATPase
MEKKKLLVHICCAPDALYVMNELKDSYDLTGFFYNPNIHPRKEYVLRLEEAKAVSGIVGFNLVEGPYDDCRWLTATKKYKDEPEKGKRCDICYALRLQRTAIEAARNGFNLYATVMSLSPWKKAESLNRIGTMFGVRHKVPFLKANFKKKDGFRKSVEMSKCHHLYRQNYCGCSYSQRKID